MHALHVDTNDRIRTSPQYLERRHCHAGCHHSAVPIKSAPVSERLTGTACVQAERLLAFVDSNADLYVCSVLAPVPVKVAGSVTSYAWNDAADILAAASDGHLLLWYCPEAAIVARDLVEVTRERRPVSLGMSPTIEAFVGAAVTVRQRDGTRIAAAANSHAIKLYSLIQHGRCAQHHTTWSSNQSWPVSMMWPPGDTQSGHTGSDCAPSIHGAMPSLQAPGVEHTRSDRVP